MTQKGKTLQYIVPKGAERGKVTINVNGYNVKGSVPSDAGPLMKVTLPILESIIPLFIIV